ncbi:hypothetical protein C8R47DRAFT_615990 [Mycena vitilis]|nr:hypothetical protein C8R47DRAFT_615990 [Mycena vitilis]
MPRHTLPSHCDTPPLPCPCGRSSDSLSRVPTRGSLMSNKSDPGPQLKVRYGGRGGAGSRPRNVVPPPIAQDESLTKGVSEPRPQSSDFKAKWLSRVASSEALDAPPPVPAIPTSSLAGRRGALNIPPPLVLRDTPSADLATPPLSAMSTTSTMADSQGARTPHSAYFYFDEAFDPSPNESPVRTPGSMSRSLGRFASRTKELFSKERFTKAPPPTPASPAPPSQLTSPSETSVRSEWFDQPEAPALPAPASAAASPTPIVVELPLSGGGRTRSASVATVKARPRTPRKQKGDRRAREPRTQGDWNREDMGEVIVALRMLK